MASSPGLMQNEQKLLQQIKSALHAKQFVVTQRSVSLIYKTMLSPEGRGKSIVEIVNLKAIFLNKACGSCG